MGDASALDRLFRAIDSQGGRARTGDGSLGASELAAFVHSTGGKGLSKAEVQKWALGATMAMDGDDVGTEVWPLPPTTTRLRPVIFAALLVDA